MTTWFQPSATFVEFGEGEIQQSIPQRFEQQVERHPNQLAVVTRTCTLSYEQLNRAANVLAWSILSHCGEGQVPVALLLDNDAPMIEALLGVLKVGKIYVPLDPSLPLSRLTYILQDSQATLVLTNTRHAELAASLAQGKVAVLNVDQLDRHADAGNPGISISPDSLTWIIYTSGSTGKPKGVVQTHGNVLHFVRNYTNGLFLSSSDRLALLYSFSVNGAAHEMFCGLLNGASLHSLDVKAEGLTGLASWLTNQQVTTYSSVPTVFRHFCETLTGTELFPRLRFIKMIGEPVSKIHVELYQKYFSSKCVFINRLGSTETGSIRWQFIDKATRIDGSSVPVGYPVADNEVLLLDDQHKEVAQGEIGEIGVKSRYLSPGYWHLPAQTNKVFLPDPQGSDERIYLTGDLGRMLADGCLVHMGRKDFQVKIRGHRIETAEVEMALLSVSGAKETLVMAREDPKGEPRLVAYLLMPGQPAPSVGALRRGLSNRLPQYMIPSAFVILDRFPLAPNGKVNRGELPQPDSSRPGLDRAFVAPSTPVELQLARIWREILSVDQVGIHDSFFDLGGDSLGGVKLCARISQTFAREVELRFLYQAPTIEQQATLLQAAQLPTLSSSESLIGLRTAGSRAPFFWVHGETSNTLLPRYLSPDQPLYGFEHQANNGKAARYTDIATIAAHYLDEMLTVQPRGPYLLGGYSAGGLIAFEMAQQLVKSGREVALLVLLDSQFAGDEIVSAPEAPMRNSSLEGVARSSSGLLSEGTGRGRLRSFVHVVGQPVFDAFRTISDSLKWVVCTVCARINLTIPFGLRSFYILRIYKLARNRYAPKIYAGSAIYFETTERKGRYSPQWAALIAGGMEIVDVPGDHRSLTREPSLGCWAEKLGAILAASPESKPISGNSASVNINTLDVAVAR